MFLIIFLIYLILIFFGFHYLRASTRESNLFRLLPASILFAIALYIFLLNLSTKIIPGKNGIYIATLFLMLCGIFVKARFKRSIQKLDKSQSFSLLFCLFIYFVVIGLSFLKMSTSPASADSEMQWAYAASFARGDYPLRVPWQPDLAPSYHLGEYFFEGSLNALSGLPLRTIHAVNNFFLLAAGTLMLIFLFWEDRHRLNNIWLIISGLVVYLAFGIIVIAIPNFGLISNNQLPEKLFSTISLRNQIPPKVDNNGGGLVDLDSLSFLPARSLNLALCILLFYFTIVTWKSEKVRTFSMVIVISTIALVEESTFLPIIMLLCLLVFTSYLPIKKITIFREHRRWLIPVLIFSLLISVLQGGFITEKIFEKNDSTFNLTLPFLSDAFMDKLQRLNNYFLTLNSKGQLFNLFIPSPLLLILFMSIISYIKKNKLPLLFALFSLINFLLFLTIEYKFASSNNVRFYNLGFIAAGLGFMYSLFLVLKNRSIKSNLLYSVILLLILSPTFNYELSFHGKKIAEGIANKTINQLITSTASSTPTYLIADWAKEHIPRTSKVSVIDKSFPTSSGSLDFEYNGIYTLYGPQYIRSLRPEPGTEYFDLALTLNPSIFKQTSVEYFYIDTDTEIYKQLPTFRKKDLDNPNYFELLTPINNGTLSEENISYKFYKLKPDFLDSVKGGEEIHGKTLIDLDKIIPKNASVFVSDYPAISFLYRMAISLALRDRQLAITLRDQPNVSFRVPYSGYMAIETKFNIINDRSDNSYDFYILPPNGNPPLPSEMVWSNLFASAWKKI